MSGLQERLELASQKGGRTADRPAAADGGLEDEQVGPVDTPRGADVRRRVEAGGHPAPDDGGRGAEASWVLDHADPETISGIAAVSDARFVSGKAISGKISSYAGRDSVALGCKKVRDFGSFRVSALPAAHEEVHMKDGESEECGFLFDFGGIKIYHPGDSLVYDGLCDSVRGADVMLLPVNGNGFYRREDGIVGNMDSFDAARLALDCGTGLLIPMHFDLYRGNSVPESAVRDIISAAAPSVRTVFPKPGEGCRISRSYAGLEVSPL